MLLSIMLARYSHYASRVSVGNHCDTAEDMSAVYNTLYNNKNKELLL